MTVLPIVKDANGQNLALTINNKRRYYGMSERSLPSGNIDGGHDNPDTAADTALRELGEEAGYGYPESARPNMDVFALRTGSNTIDYPRFLAVVRDVIYLANEQLSPAEVISVNPTPLGEYTDELLKLDNGRTYPEVNAAFAKAGMEHGREAVLSWLTGDLAIPGATDVPGSFEPWLLRA